MSIFEVLVMYFNSGRIPMLRDPGPEGPHEKHRAKIQELIFTQASTRRRCDVFRTFSGFSTWPGPVRQEHLSGRPLPLHRATELRTFVFDPKPWPVSGCTTSDTGSTAWSRWTASQKGSWSCHTQT